MQYMTATMLPVRLETRQGKSKECLEHQNKKSLTVLRRWTASEAERQHPSSKMSLKKILISETTAMVALILILMMTSVVVPIC